MGAEKPPKSRHKLFLIMKKVLFFIATLFLSTSLNAINVTVYGSGGVTYKNGEARVCPNESEAKCATLDIKTGELIELTKAGERECHKRYRLVHAEVFILDNGDIGMRNVVLREYKMRRP